MARSTTADALRAANARFAKRHPGESERRQPVHTVYGGAHLFRSDTARKLGEVALRALKEFAPDPVTLADALGWAEPPLGGIGGLAAAIHDRVAAKLRREPVEDFRIDFEDGYGNRPDAEEDGHAWSAATEVARGQAEGTLPAFIGVRIKPLNEELRRRSVRTLELFLETLLAGTSGRLPANFVVTLPKVTVTEQVAYFVGVLARLERVHRLAKGSLRFELMVETPQCLGVLSEIHQAARGRMAAAHFGTYDYTAGLNITAACQRMRHPACDHAKHVMQVAFAGTGVWLSDGSTTLLPVGDRAAVHRAWKLHYDDVRQSLQGGFYQGWDLHPAQLVTRYAALFAFFLEGLDAAGARLRNFVANAAQATLVGDVFDDAATGQGLLNYFLRGINCGALTEQEALPMTGLKLEELRGRSFVRILRKRR